MIENLRQQLEKSQSIKVTNLEEKLEDYQKDRENMLKDMRLVTDIGEDLASDVRFLHSIHDFQISVLKNGILEVHKNYKWCYRDKKKKKKKIHTISIF